MLAAAIQNVNYDPAAKSITLSGAATWPDLGGSSVLYVRFFYKDLWESVLHSGRVVPHIIHGAVIIGSPGCKYYYLAITSVALLLNTLVKKWFTRWRRVA